MLPPGFVRMKSYKELLRTPGHLQSIPEVAGFLVITTLLSLNLLPASSVDLQVAQHKSSEEAAKEHTLQVLAPGHNKFLLWFTNVQRGEWRLPGEFLPPSTSECWTFL